MSRIILSAEDDLAYGNAVARALRRFGYDVDRTSSGEMALDLVKSHPQGYYECILVDYLLPGMTGVAFITELRKFDDKVGVVVLTGLDIEDIEKECEGLSVWAVIEKTSSPDLIADKIRNAQELAHLSPEIERAFNTETRHLRQINQELMDETGIHRAVKRKEG